MARLPLSGKIMDRGPQDPPVATPTSYRSFVAGNPVSWRVNVECCLPPGGGGLDRGAQTRASKHKQGIASDFGRSIPSALLAGSGLCISLICAFADGFLTADQIQPLFLWMRLHQPLTLRTGCLSYLLSHWPAPQFHWSPPFWIGIGLVTALAGKGALLPAQRVARLAGKHAVLTLRLLVLVAGIAGGIALISGCDASAFSTVRHALTSTARTLTLPAKSLGE